MTAQGSQFVEQRVVVLGVGNVLWADEGFGVRCVEALGEAYEFPAGVELVDGGTLGLALIPVLQEATHVLLFDAVDHGAEPGTLIVARDEQIPRFFSQGKMSLHQATMNDVLACLDMLGHRPGSLTLIGVRPVQLADYGGSLTTTVREQLVEALRLALEELGRWGIAPTARLTSDTPAVMIKAVAMQEYETGRPAAEVACRIGDERFLAMRQRGGTRADEESS